MQDKPTIFNRLRVKTYIYNHAKRHTSVLLIDNATDDFYVVDIPDLTMMRKQHDVPLRILALNELAKIWGTQDV